MVANGFGRVFGWAAVSFPTVEAAQEAYLAAVAGTFLGVT